jgi:hypothetical protein
MTRFLRRGEVGEILLLSHHPVTSPFPHDHHINLSEPIPATMIQFPPILVGNAGIAIPDSQSLISFMIPPHPNTRLDHPPW